MSERLRTSFVLLLTLALMLSVLGVAGCGGAAEPEEPIDTEEPVSESPVVGGDLVIGYDQEPAILNPFIEGGDMMATKDAISNVLYGLLRAKPDLTYEALLVEEVPTVENGLVTEDPFTVTYTIKEEAVWSDGTPITSADVKFTWETIMSDDWKILSRLGYEKITEIETPDDKTATLVFSEPYAPYRDLFSSSGVVLPKHVLEGEDFDTVMNDEVPVASGPFVFDKWNKGDSIALARNDAFWGPNTAYLDTVTFKYIPETNTIIAQFETGEVHAINPPPDVALIDQIDAVGEVQADPGTIWEHIAFNLEKDHISDVKVRQAIAYGIDRQAIADQVMAGQVRPLNSILVPEQPTYYIPAWEKYTLDKEMAEELLEEAGYTKGADGFYAKDGQKLSLKFRTTAGNVGREKMQQIVQANLKEVGIEVIIDNVDATTFFSESTVNGDFEMAEWAWLASPDPSATTLFAEDSVPPDGQNYYRYRNAEVTQALKDSDVEAIESERIALMKTVQELMAEDVPLIPLYQRLSILGYQSNIVGPQNNPTLEGVFWNLGEWWMKPGM